MKLNKTNVKTRFVTTMTIESQEMLQELFENSKNEKIKHKNDYLEDLIKKEYKKMISKKSLKKIITDNKL